MKIKNLTLGRSGKSLLISIMLISVIALAIIAFVVALTDEERQQLELEKVQLESELVSEGYEWLVDYSGVVENVFVEKLNKLRGELNG